MGNFFKWEYIGYYFPKILSAVPVTLSIVLAASLMGVLAGMILAFIRLEKVPILDLFAKIYISFFRATPIIIQLFIVYYGFPALFGRVGINMSGWEKIYFVYITYGLNMAAFLAEVFRAALLSVPVSQFEAAASIGLTKVQSYQRIVIPQAVRIAIPNVGAAVVNLLQNTSLAFSLGIIDVIGKVKTLGALTYRSMEGYFVATIIFVVLSILLEHLFSGLSKKMDYQNKTAKKATKGRATILEKKVMEVPAVASPVEKVQASNLEIN